MTYFTSQYRPIPQLNPATTPLVGTELTRLYQDGEERSAAVTTLTAGSQPLDSTLTAIAALTGTGIIVRSGSGDTDAVVRTITQSTGITVANGSGVAGNPTISITNSGVTAATYGSVTKSAILAINAQGQVTTASESTITPAVGSITGLGANVATALTVAVGSAGAFIIFNGNAGTPSALVLTNATGLPVPGGGTGAATLTAGGILLGNGTGAISALTTATAGLGVVSGASAAPTFQNNAVRAHILFDGTGTPAARGTPYNVASITDNGTGDYTINFSTALPSANYTWALSARTAGGPLGVNQSSTTAPTASALRITVFNTLTGLATDSDYISVMCVGG